MVLDFDVKEIQMPEIANLKSSLVRKTLCNLRRFTCKFWCTIFWMTSKVLGRCSERFWNLTKLVHFTDNPLKIISKHWFDCTTRYVKFIEGNNFMCIDGNYCSVYVYLKLHRYGLIATYTYCRKNHLFVVVCHNRPRTQLTVLVKPQFCRRPLNRLY